MRIVIAGGGTGGHVFPAIALADEFKRIDRHIEIIFMGTPLGLENKVVPSYGYRLELLDVEGIKKKDFVGKLRAIRKAASATFKAMRRLSKIKPDGVIGCGSYSSGPVLLGARLMGIKTALLEQNVLPGLTNRILGRFVDRIYTAFDESLMYFPGKKTMVSGNPVRREILGQAGTDAMKEEKNAPPTHAAWRGFPGGSQGMFTLLVFGGSQGAKAINAAFLDSLEYLADVRSRLRIIHQTGAPAYRDAAESYRRKGIAVELYEFIEDMAAVYSSADLVICRAGATTIAEITALGLPSILIPYPFASDGHQERNAAAIAKKGAAVMLTQDTLTGKTLANAIRRFFENPGELRRVRTAVAALGRPKAGAVIAADYMKLLSRRGTRRGTRSESGSGGSACTQI